MSSRRRAGPIDKTTLGRRLEMTTTTSRISQINLVIIPSTDEARSMEFCGALGFEKRPDSGLGGESRWVGVSPPNGTAGIALAPPRPGDATGVQTGISLATEDIEASHAHLRSL